MSNKKIYKNRLSLPIFDSKGIGNGNGVAYIPNVIRGGSAIPIGNNMFLMRGRSHAQGGIDIGRDLEVEGNEVVQNGKFGTKVFSSVPFLRGVSPAERVLRGENPDTVFAAQETWKRVNKVADDGSKRAALGLSLFKPNSFKVRRVPINDFITPTLGEVEEPETPSYTLTDDEKPVAKAQEYAKVAEALKAYPYGNKSSETTNAIDNTLFDDIKGERGFNKSEMRTIYKYLNDNGSNLSDYAKSAILATIAFESGANIRARNPRSSAKGYFQWLDDRYKFANNLSDEEERKLQLQKIINDMNPTDALVNKAKDARGWTSVGGRGYLKTAEDFRKAQDTLTAVNLITRGHIRPGNQDWEVAHRKMLADMFYNAIAKSKNRKAFGGEDKVYTAPKWAQDSYKKHGKIIIGGEPLGIGLGVGRVGTFTGLMRNNLLRNAFRNFKKYGSKASTIIKDSYYDLTDALARPFIHSEKAYKTFKKVRGIGYNTIFGDRRLDGAVKTGKGDFEFFSDLSRLPITFNNANNIINSEKQFGGMKLNIFKLGGLSRSKDYGSKDKPYPSVNKNDFAGGGRSYPIPTRADAVDALRLAGLHHRSDVRAKVYAKYPDLRKKAAMGTIDDEDVLEALRAGNVRNATAEERVVEPVRTNYVERNNSSDNFGLGIGTILGGGAALSGLGYAGNKLNNYFSEDAINGRRVAKILKNQENIRQAIEDRPKVLGKRFGKELSRVRINTPISNESFDLTHRINYEEPIRDINNVPASLERRDARIAAGVKAAKNKIKTDNTNVAKAIKNSAKNFKGGIVTIGRLFPAFAAIDFVRNLFPSKQQEQEADKAWRRYKSPTGRISEDYQLKFGGRRKAPYGTYITIGGRRVPLVFDTNNKLSDQVLNLMYPTIAAGTQNLPKDFNRLSLLNTNNIGTGGSLVHAVPNRQNSNGSYFPINFDRLSRADVQNLGLTPNFPSMGFDLRGMNDFTLNALFGNLKPKDIRNAQTLSDVARGQETSLGNPARSWVYNVPDYTGNINGQEVVINPAYMRQVPRSVRQAVLNNTPEIVRGTSSTRRSTNSTISVNRARELFSGDSSRNIPEFYQRERIPMFETNPLVSRFYNYGWSHNGNGRTIAPTENLDAANRIARYDLSTYFNNNNTSRTPRRTQPVRVRTERVGNVPEAYKEFRRPNLTQLETKGIGLNMPAYTSPFTPTTTSGTRTYDIGVPTTLDTSRLDSILSKYGVAPISSSTGVQPNPTDVEAVRSGNFKAIDNDRYIPIRTTTEDWVGLGANLLGSIGSYLGTRAMLKHYPMPNKPVPAIAQKLKTRVNINPQLDTLREQADKLKTSIDNNTSSSRVAQARKQGVMNNAVASRNQLFGQKENAETQLINQDIMNRQRIGLYNNQIFNNYLGRLGSTRQYVASGKINNINNLINGTNQSIQDLLGRIDDRDANLRNFIFMEAAYPNVNWRNIFGNPELARSLGFRFV